jgi:hypothetical protein
MYLKIIEDNRKGWFLIREKFLVDNPDLIAKILSKVLIIECYDYDEHRKCYIGYSEVFDRNGPHNYEVIVDENDDFTFRLTKAEHADRF